MGVKGIGQVSQVIDYDWFREPIRESNLISVVDESRLNTSWK